MTWGHDCRLAALNVHPRVAMRILRHSKIAITMEVYTEVPSDATRDALRKLSAMLVAAVYCCRKVKEAGSRVRDRPLCCAGDTGIETVTSSV